jgi:xylulokinase
MRPGEGASVSYYLGIDTSTTATKALVMDADGTVVAVGRSEYGFETPHPLWSEQSPQSWWQATIDAIAAGLHDAGVRADEVAAVGLTGQMHGLVLLDAAGEVLRPAILWNDQRTQAECDEIRDRVGRAQLIATTGNDALTGFTAPKLLWVLRHEPEVAERIAHVLLPKDYVRFRLTGGYALDKADGSGTMLFDLARRDWSPAVLEALGFAREWLPETFEGPEVTGTVSADAAAATGLREGTPVVAGGGDQAANGIGVGAVTSGIVAISLGTSGVVFAAADHPVIEPDGRLHGFCHAVPDTWHAMGVMLSAAGSLRWFRDTLAPQRSYAELDGLAAAVPAGADGLVFLPYLTGERTPHPDPTARGAFVGLTVRHEVGHLTRAVMEGVAFGLRDAVELLRGITELGEIRVAGGGAQSPAWLAILADVLDRPVRVAGTVEAAAHGAAMLAAVSDGSYSSVPEACAAIVHVGPATEPTGAAARYAEPYAIYRGLYPDLRGTFARLSAVDT